MQLLKAAGLPNPGRASASFSQRVQPPLSALVSLAGALVMEPRLEASVMEPFCMKTRSPGFTAILDGDMLRKGLSRNLGFSDEDRKENLRRATELALHLADAGVVVVAAFISPFRADRAMIAERARERGMPFAEVFINAPLAECERRDPKQLYKRAREGKRSEEH